MNQKILSSLCGLKLLFLFGCSNDHTGSHAVDDRPHIVLLIADDLGIDAAPCHDSDSEMAFLSDLCSRSLVAKRAYAPPYCSASRASLLTGRYTFRHGVDDVREEATKLHLDETTLAEVLSAATPEPYRTAAFGKWHLADDANGGILNPNLQGFDFYAGTPRQSGTYNYFSYGWVENGADLGTVNEYKTSRIVNRAIEDFHRYHEFFPQFYWIGFVNPHFPYHSPPADLHSRQPLPDQTLLPTISDVPTEKEYRMHRREPRLDKHYSAMLEALDSEIERMVLSFEAISTRPIVFIFLGDNGSAAEVHRIHQAKDTYRAKSSLYDGGVRIPIQIWRTGAANSRYQGTIDSLIHIVDLFPTIVEISQNDANSLGDIDGQSILSTTHGRHEYMNHRPRKFLYLQRGNRDRLAFAYGAVNDDGLKLILREPDRERRMERKILMEAYATSEDPLEQDNILDQPCKAPMASILSLFQFIKLTLGEDAHNFTNFDPLIYEEAFEKIAEACSVN